MKHRAARSIKHRTVNIIGVACLMLAAYFTAASTAPKPPEAPEPTASAPAPQSAMVVVSNLGEGNLYAQLLTKPNGWVKEFVNQGTRADGKHCLETEEPEWYCGPRNHYALKAYCRTQTVNNQGIPEFWFAVAVPEELIFKNGGNLAFHNSQRLAYINSRYTKPASQAEMLPSCNKLLRAKG